MIKKIGIKYCGNCNPVLDSRGLVEKLRVLMPEKRLLRWDDPEIEALVILNGCARNCVTRPSFAGPVLVVAGSTLEGWEKPPPELSTCLVKRIAYLDRQETGGCRP